MDQTKYAKALEELEVAITNFVRASRDEEEVGTLYVNDYVLAVASESMNDSNHTYFNFIRPKGISKYQTRGLLTEAMHQYRPDSE